MEELSKEELKRRIVGNSFPSFADLADAFESLQFVQADPIRSPARAQDLILAQRVTDYRAGDLEKEYPELGIEEGYLFAYGFMKPEVWNLLRPPKTPRLYKKHRAVLDAVREIGEAHPKQLAAVFGRKSVINAWGGKSQEAKRLLEDLHDWGLLRVCRRAKGVRVYGRVAGELEGSSESPEVRFRKILLTVASVFGPVHKRFLMSEVAVHFHLVSSAAKRNQILSALVKSGQLNELRVDGIEYLWIKDRWPEGDVQERVRILAPFDPLVRDRSRFERLWNWNYRFEAYVPAAKRERGYYAMPLLWRDEVVGWANAKVLDSRLQLEIGYVNGEIREAAFRSHLESEAERMTRFLGLPSGGWVLT